MKPNLPTRILRRLRRYACEYPLTRPFIAGGGPDDQWARIVQNERTLEMIRALAPERLSVLEISGDDWKRRFVFKEFLSLSYPDYDICSGPVPGKTFDLVIAEHVLEHILWPRRAVENVHRMLNPGGAFLVATPFLVKVHNFPIDCSRWTETGLKYLLADGGFDLDRIETGSWGNRDCVIANWKRWQIYQPWRHSLKNESDYPVVVWALART